MEYNIAAELEEQLVTRQPWCDCEDPYYCNGDELSRDTCPDDCTCIFCVPGS